MSQPWLTDRQDVQARRMAMAAQQAAQQARDAVVAVTPSVGTAVVPALALGASTTVVVTLSPVMPSAQYVAVVSLQGSAGLLGSLVVNGIVAQTTTSVSVSVKAPVLAVSAGAVLQVVAFRTA